MNTVSPLLLLWCQKLYNYYGAALTFQFLVEAANVERAQQIDQEYWEYVQKKWKPSHMKKFKDSLNLIIHMKDAVSPSWEVYHHYSEWNEIYKWQVQRHVLDQVPICDVRMSHWNEKGEHDCNCPNPRFKPRKRDYFEGFARYHIELLEKGEDIFY